MLLEINGKRYPVKGMEDLTLRHVAQLQFELADGQFSKITSLRTLPEIQAALGAWGAMPKAEQEGSPNAMFLTCFVIWATRSVAGEDLTLLEAISAPAGTIRWIREPTDAAPVSVGKGPAARRRGKAKARR